MDKRKMFTWPACLLGLYPQLRAANIIRELWRNPRRGLVKKRKFERDIVETEVFLEAVPNTYILTYIITRISETGDIIAQNGFRGAPGSYNIILFSLSFLTSVISASLSMAKCLKVIREGFKKTLPEAQRTQGIESVA